MLKALYGMLVASLLYYKKFRKDIEAEGFMVNPYNLCVANCIIKGKQQTVTRHVKDLKSSHVDPTVNHEFYNWWEKTNGSEENGHVTTTRGPKHDYLAMILDYSSPGVLIVDMQDYLNTMVEEFLYKFHGTQNVPWNEKLFKVDNTPKLDEKR